MLPVSPRLCLWEEAARMSLEGLVECYVRVALCQPQISHGLAWDQAHAPAARGRLLTSV